MIIIYYSVNIEIKLIGCNKILTNPSDGVRVDIPKGPITKRVISEAFPFPNKTMIVKVNGNFIKKMVLKSLTSERSLFQYAGVEVVYKYKNNRPELVSLTINGQPVDKDKMYSIAVNDYIAMGNSEGYMFKKVQDKTVFDNRMMSEIFIDFLKANPQGVSAPSVGRIKKVQ